MWDWWNENYVSRAKKKRVFLIDDNVVNNTRAVTLIKRILGITRKEVRYTTHQEKIRVLEWAGHRVSSEIRPLGSEYQ